jgi:hypothetical protein
MISWIRDVTGGFSGALLFLTVATAITSGALPIRDYSMRDIIGRPKIKRGYQG